MYDCAQEGVTHWRHVACSDRAAATLTSSSPTDFSRMLMALLHSLSASSNLQHFLRSSFCMTARKLAQQEALHQHAQGVVQLKHSTEQSSETQ